MARQSEPAMETEPFRRRPRILLADKHPDSRQYVTQLLAKDYDIRAADDAPATLALALEWNPDVLVANVAIRAAPEYNLLRQSRRGAWGTTPVIWYSMPGGEESSAVVSQGVDNANVTALPSSEHELLALVRVHCQVTQLRDESMQALRLSEERFRTLK